MIDLLPTEKRAAKAIALVFLLRDLGLMMVLPVFVAYARELSHASALMIGMALGAYGLSAALLQAPLCHASRILGRKLVAVVGLIVFAVGSYIAAQMHSVEWLLVGRLLQGAGAVGMVLLVMAADLSRDVARFKVTSVIGMAVGLSLLLAMVLGAGLVNKLGLSGLFMVSAALAVMAIILVLFVVPRVGHRKHHCDLDMRYRDIKSVMMDPNMMRLNVGAFVLHFVLLATFVVAPLFMFDHLNIDKSHIWAMYIPALLVAFIALFPAALLAERYRQLKRMVTLSIMLLIAAELMWYIHPQSYVVVQVGLVLFFTGFVVLQALLPSWLSKIVPLDKKGTAVGLFSISQFLGAFAGGVVGGALISGGALQVYLVCIGLLALWLMLAGNAFPPMHVTTRVYTMDQVKDAQHAEALRQQFLQVTGVVDAVVVVQDKMAYLRVDAGIFDTSDSVSDALTGLAGKV